MSKPKWERRYRLRFRGEDVSVTGPEFVIGREADCDLVLKQDLVSRHHARLTETEDGLEITDLGSMNGVFVNQRRVREPTLLAHGDQIALGRESLEVIDVLVVPRAAKPTRPQEVNRSRQRSDGEEDEPDTVVAQLDMLSPREREIFELIVLGHAQREIGQKLFISVKTIETHRAHIAEKLGCRTRAELVAYAIAAGVLRR